MSNVANRDTLSGAKSQSKDDPRAVRDKISMVRVVIGDLLLEDMLVRMWRGKSFIIFVGGGMHRVSVGPKVRVTGVEIVEEIIIQMSVANLTRSLGCLNLWPTHTNRRETICKVLGHREDFLMTLGRRIFIMTMGMLGKRSTHRGRHFYVSVERRCEERRAKRCKNSKLRI